MCSNTRKQCVPGPGMQAPPSENTGTLIKQNPRTPNVPPEAHLATGGLRSTTKGLRQLSQVVPPSPSTHSSGPRQWREQGAMHTRCTQGPHTRAIHGSTQAHHSHTPRNTAPSQQMENQGVKPCHTPHRFVQHQQAPDAGQVSQDAVRDRVLEPVHHIQVAAALSRF